MTQSEAPDNTTPFHEGELEVQERLGVREKVQAYAPRFIRESMPGEHREFYAEIPYLFVGSTDQDGQPWASLLVGLPGFISSPDDRTLAISARLLEGDPLVANLAAGTPLGLLGLELETRRRNRVNGRVKSIDDDGFVLDVDQSFGNCPKYIQTREMTFTEVFGKETSMPNIIRDKKIGDKAGALIAQADTFFIASMASQEQTTKAHGVDVSHRGGNPGFVRVDDDGTLLFPDFVGNRFFNTLGNIMVHPKVGLLFPDFDTGDLLYIAGEAEIIWEPEELAAFDGAERFVRVRVTQTIRVEKSMPIIWQFQEASPYLARTGNWI